MKSFFKGMAKKNKKKIKRFLMNHKNYFVKIVTHLQIIHFIKALVLEITYAEDLFG